MNKREIETLIAERGRKASSRMRIIYDTSEFMAINPGDVMVLSDKPYLITRNEKEAGYGQDDDPKFWVKRTIDLLSGEVKIIKLVYFEEFGQKVGGYTIPFYRSPQKEARVLDVVQGHPQFMQGFHVLDTVGNEVRIIDFIQGRSLNNIVGKFDIPHEDFFYKELPEILKGTVSCLQALAYLHENNLVHGDVRWEHILFDRNTSMFRWIDFDYHYDFPENPFGMDLIGLGNVLVDVIGMGSCLYSSLKLDQSLTKIMDILRPEDFSILDKNRLVNVKKVYPYIPERLNNILLSFSGHATVFYDTVADIILDLEDAILDL